MKRKLFKNTLKIRVVLLYYKTLYKLYRINNFIEHLMLCFWLLIGLNALRVIYNFMFLKCIRAYKKSNARYSRFTNVYIF